MSICGLQWLGCQKGWGIQRSTSAVRDRYRQVSRSCQRLRNVTGLRSHIKWDVSAHIEREEDPSGNTGESLSSLNKIHTLTILSLSSISGCHGECWVAPFPISVGSSYTGMPIFEDAGVDKEDPCSWRSSPCCASAFDGLLLGGGYANPWDAASLAIPRVRPNKCCSSALGSAAWQGSISGTKWTVVMFQQKLCQWLRDSGYIPACARW